MSRYVIHSRYLFSSHQSDKRMRLRIICPGNCYLVGTWKEALRAVQLIFLPWSRNKEVFSRSRMTINNKCRRYHTNCSSRLIGSAPTWYYSRKDRRPIMGNFFAFFYPTWFMGRGRLTRTTNILVYFYDKYIEAVVRELIKYVQCIMKVKELFWRGEIQQQKATFKLS